MKKPKQTPTRRATPHKALSTLADVRRAKAAFDEIRDRKHAVGMERCLVVVGYADGREPFRLLARVAADLGLDDMPDPPLTMTEMQPVAFAAKMAIAKVLREREREREPLDPKFPVYFEPATVGPAVVMTVTVPASVPTAFAAAAKERRAKGRR